jgi:GT2 family glycosyltransferase
LGGAGGFNFGIREALKRNYDYIWLMDDDTMVENPDTLGSFIKKAELLNDDFSFMSCIAKWTDGSLCIMNRQKFSEEWYEHADVLDKGLIPIKAATFVSFFMSAKVAKKAGLPIKEFFIYSDDIEYSYRMNKIKQGYLNVDTCVLHKMKKNTGGSTVTAPFERIERTFYSHRNLEYIVRHHYNKRERRYGYSHKYLQNVYYILRLSPDHKMKRIWVLTKGKIAGKFFNPEVEKK